MREKIFWNLIAKKYSNDKISDMKGYNHSTNLTRKYLNKKQKVLEIGCGTSSTAILLATRVGQYDATDVSSKMISIGNEKVKEKGLKNLKVFTSTMFDKKLKKNSYDVVNAFNIVHLLKNRDDAFNRVNELLKSGGYFISKTPCLGRSKKMKIIAFFIQILIGPIKCFTVDQYVESIEKAGFKIVEKNVYKGDMPRVFIVAKKK